MGLLRTVSLFWFTNFHSKIKTSYFLKILVWIPSWPCWHTNAQHTDMLLLLLLLSRFSRVRLCDPRDGSPPGSPVPGILQARTLEWVAISFSYAWKWKVKVKSLSRVWLLATPWTAAYQAPPSMGFSRQEYWSGLPLLSPIQVCTQTLTSKMNQLFELWLSITFWSSPLSLQLSLLFLYVLWGRMWKMRNSNRLIH